MTARPLDAHAQFACEALHHRILSTQEEYALARRWRESGHTDTAARDALVTHNLRLVHDMAYHYARHATNMEHLDLVQEGIIGLMHAIDKYDERTNNRLTTYAMWWVRQAVARSLADKDPAIHVPEPVARAERRRADGCWTLPHVAVSLDAQVSESVAEDVTVGDLIADEASDGDATAEALCAEESGSDLWRVCRMVLTAREAEVIRLRYGLDGDELSQRQMRETPMGALPTAGLGDAQHTFATVGAHLGIARESARQLERVALAKLRARLTRDATSGAVTAQVKTRKRPAREPSAILGQIGSAA